MKSKVSSEEPTGDVMIRSSSRFVNMQDMTDEPTRIPDRYQAVPTPDLVLRQVLGTTRLRRCSHESALILRRPEHQVLPDLQGHRAAAGSLWISWRYGRYANGRVNALR